jgi:hypothetical protein
MTASGRSGRRRTYTAPVSDSTTKPAVSADIPRPNTITYAVIALAVTGASAILAALTLFGVKPWIEKSVRESDAKAKPPITRTSSEMHDHVSQIVVSQLVANIVLALALAFIAYGVWRGRPWSRWGVVGVWIIGTYTGTLAGIASIFAVGGDAPGAFKVTAFLAGLAMVAAVFLVNLRPSTQYFTAHKPAAAQGVAPRPSLRELFAPRGPRSTTTTAPAEKPAAKPAGAPKAKAKTRSDEAAVAKGAELARNRAKASKSRRTES